MEYLVSIAVGVLVAGGIYLVLRLRTFPVILGISLLSYAVNLFLFAMGRLVFLPPISIGDTAALYRSTAAGARPHRDRHFLRHDSRRRRAGAQRPMSPRTTTWIVRARGSGPERESRVMNHLIAAPRSAATAGGRHMILSCAIRPGSSVSVAIISCCRPGRRAGFLRRSAAGAIQIYELGNWPAPFGIVLVLDRLAAIMLVLTAVIALAVVLYALRGVGPRGPALPCAPAVPADGIERRLSDRRPLQSLRVLRSVADRVLRTDAAWRRARSGCRPACSMWSQLAGSTLFLFALGLIYASPARSTWPISPCGWP